MAYSDALRGYAYRVLRRDDFRCAYCGVDGRASLSNWLHLSWDHLLPVGHPNRDQEDFIVTACRFCNEAHNRTVWEIDGKTPDELVAQKKPAVLARRAEYEEFWRTNVKRSD